MQRRTVLTAALWNTMAAAVNQGLRAPRSLEDSSAWPEGVDPAADLFATEVSRSSVTVRVTNPQDENQFVDVARPTAIRFSLSDGRTMQLTFNV